MDGRTYRVGAFALEPYRQLLRDGVPVQIGRKPLALLSVLALAEGGLVTKDELMRAVWPNSIVEENAVQAQIAGLRKLLGPEADRLSTARGIGYRLAIDAEETPVLQVRQSGALPISAAAGRRASAALVAACLLLAAGAALWLLHGRSPVRVSAPAPGARVAILPLAVVGKGAGARALAAGFGDQVAVALASAQLSVISDRPSSHIDRIGGTAASAADLIIGGAVQEDGGALDVVVRLTDAREGVVLWSDQRHGSAASPRALEAAAAARVANAVYWAKIGRSGSVRLGAVALAAFIDGGERLTGVREGGDAMALADFRRVISLAPGFSDGHSDAATMLAFEAENEPVASEADRLRAAARQEAHRALALDPHNGEAYLALELTLPVTAWAARERLLLAGAAVEPGSEPIMMMEGRLLWHTGRTSEAVNWFERAHALNPFHAGTTWSYALILGSVGQTAESGTLLSGLETQWPDIGYTPNLRRWLPFVEGSASRTLAAVTELETASAIPKVDVQSWKVALRGMAASKHEEKAAAATAIRAAISADWISVGSASLMLAQLGDVEAAFAALRSYRIGLGSAPPYLFLPPAAPLRADPRFMQLAQRLGLVAYWRATGRWPDFCSEPGLAYDCRAEATKLARGN